MIPDRNIRVGRSIYKLICNLFFDEIYNKIIKDNVVITNVEVSKDLKVAKIFFIAKNRDEKIIDKILKELERLKSFLRKRIADEINLKYCPDIIFKFDYEEDRANRVDELIEKVIKKEK
ncbi:MAG: 30S ribosome-binding factor RbfA [Spirochaetes bacterium]|nr:30S ribosome-binding factor RbfA [Spirochaetota bacterium]